MIEVQHSLAAALEACNNTKTHEPLLFGLLRGLLLENLVPPGSIIDAGANNGNEACLLAVSSRERMVYAIDPLQQNVDYMTRRFANIASNLRPMLGGLGHDDRILRAGPRAVAMAAGPWAPVKLKQLHAVAPHWVSVDGTPMLQVNASKHDVPIFRMDTLFATKLAGKHLGLVHLDLEGYELAAIAGAARTIMRYRPFVTVEVFPRSKGGSTRAILNHTEAALDYDAFVIEESCGYPADCRNVLLVPRERLPSLSGSRTLESLVAARKLFAMTSNNTRYPASGSSLPSSKLSFAAHAQFLRDWRTTGRTT